MRINVENLLYNKMVECRDNSDILAYNLDFSFESGLKFTPKNTLNGEFIRLGKVDSDSYYQNFDSIYLDTLLDLVEIYIKSSEKERKNYFGFYLEDSVIKDYESGTISLYTSQDFADYLKEEDDLLDKQAKLQELGLSSYEELEALDPQKYVIEDSCSYTGFLRLFHQ